MGVWGLGFGVWGLGVQGFRVLGLQFGVKGGEAAVCLRIGASGFRAPGGQLHRSARSRKSRDPETPLHPKPAEAGVQAHYDVEMEGVFRVRV